ncbi:hypothetical protein BRD19_07145, partial [Halobacteriales archaeon SW_7_65_23]
MQLHWHRRDLRLADNRGLAAATAAGETVPVFVFDPRGVGAVRNRSIPIP